MARRKRIMPDIPVEALTFDMDSFPAAEVEVPDSVDDEGALDGAAGLADGVLSSESGDVPEQNTVPSVELVEPEHKAIGNWDAILWRGRPMWRHKRTGQTLHKREEVWRLRNLK